MFAYSNNGFSFRSVDDDYVIQEIGEVVFSDYATTEQLNSAFPLYNSGVPILTLEEQASAIEAKYKPKLDNYKELILSTIAVDGTTQASKTSYFQSKYNEELTKQNNELEALYL